MAIIESIVGANETMLRVRIQQAARQITSSRNVQILVRDELAAPGSSTVYTLVLVAHECLFKFAGSALEYARTMEQIAGAVDSPERLRRLFAAGMIAPFSRIEKIECVPANYKIELHFHDGARRRKLTINEILAAPFDSLWSHLQERFQASHRRIDEKAGVVESLVKTPVLALCIPAAIMFVIFSRIANEPRLIWVAIGCVIIALVNTAIRLFRWPVKTTLQPLVLACILLAGTPLGAQDPSTISEATRVHVLLLMDTDADEIGHMVAVGAKELGKLFAQAQSLDKRVSVTALSGKDVTPESVKTYFRGLPSDPTQAVVVIYDGHGGEKQGEHYLAMKHGSIYRKQVLSLIREKNPRLAILYTCSCGGSGGASDRDTKLEFRAMRPVGNLRGRTFVDLFLRGTGTVDLNSSKPGIISWVTLARGSLGAHALATALTADLDDIEVVRPDGFVEWEEATEFLLRMTNAYTGTKNDGTLVQILDNVQAASPMKLHKPGSIPPWRLGVKVSTHWSGSGVMVESVEAGTPAAAAGLRQLDRIVSVNGTAIDNSWHDFSRAIRDSKGNVEFVLERITRLGETAPEAKLERIHVSMPVLRDTMPRRFIATGNDSPLFDVKTYFQQLYQHHCRRLDNGTLNLAYGRYTTDELRTFAWFVTRCPKAKMYGGTLMPVVWKPTYGIEAASFASKASQSKDPLLLSTLAAAYAEVREFGNAVEHQSAACRLAPPEHKREFERRLLMYKRGTAFSEPF